MVHKFPTMVQIESSTKCNNRCIFCPHKDMHRQGGDMSDETFEKILQDLIPCGSMEILLFLNGEPLLFPRLFEWLEKLRQKSHKTTLFTNCSLLDEGMAERIVSFSDVIHTMVLSLSGINKETFWEISHQDFDSTLVNVKKFVEINDGKINIYAHIPLFSKSIEFIDKWRIFWDDIIGAGKSGATAMVNWAGRISDDYEIKEGQSLTKNPCGRLDHLTVLWNGDVCLCCLDYEGQVIFGNVNESPVLDIFNCELFEKYRQFHSVDRFSELELCNKCNALLG